MNNKIKDILIILFVVLILVFIAPFTRNFINSIFFIYNSKYFDNDLILVAIDQKTLNDPNFKRYWDLNRADYADILWKISSFGTPKAIWVDIVFINKSSEENEDKKLQDILDKNTNIFIWSEVSIDNSIPEETKPNIWQNIWQNIWHVNTNPYNNIFNYWIDIHNSIPLFHLEKSLNISLPISFAIYKYLNPNIDINNIPHADWDFQVNFFADKDYYQNNWKIVSFIDIINDHVDYNIFKDKVVFIWATAQDLHDEFFTSYNPTKLMPWVLIHTNAYNTLSSWKFIKYQWILWFVIMNVLFLLFITFVSVRSSNIYKWVVYSFGLLVLFMILTFIVFISFGYLIENFPTIIWFVLINTILFIDKYIQEKKSKDSIKNVFSKYVSKDVVNQIIQTWMDKLSLDWQNRYVTVFFSDLAGFTDLSENLNPQDLWKILNIYFEEMSNIILSTWWTIDKFIWDAIMAFWNAPFDIQNHQDMACRTAILQRKALIKIRDELKNMWSNVYINMRIWINTGNVVIWNFWSSKRYDYTALGDNVNLASRLEWINKQYWTNVIITEETYNWSTKDMFITRDLDLITVKWKNKPVKILELIDFKEWETKEIITIIKTFESWLALYRKSEFAKAKEIFESLQDIDPPSKVFTQRCEEFITQHIINFDWVYRFKIK